MKIMNRRAGVILAAGLSIPILTGCLPESGSASDRPGTESVAPDSSAGAQAGGGASADTGTGDDGSGGGSRRPGESENLKVTPAVRKALGDTYFAITKEGGGRPRSRSKVIGPEQVFYGRIMDKLPAGDIYYAMGETGYSDDPISRQDGPHVWRRTGNSPWKYLGDTGGSVCDMVPESLMQVWNQRC